MADIENEAQETEEDLIEPTEDDSGEDAGDEDLEDEHFSLDFDDEGELEVDESQDDEDEDEEDDEDPGDSKPDDEPDFKTQITNLQKQVEDANKRANSAAYAARKAEEAARKTQGADKEDDELSDDQIKSIMKEHKDDPTVMFNAIKYLVGKEAKGATKDQIDTQKVTQTQAQLDDYMNKSFPGYADEGTELNSTIQSVKQRMNIQDHPFGDFLAMSTITHGKVGDFYNAGYEKGKADALSEKADGKRKNRIKANATTPSRKKKTKGDGDSIPSAYRETAKQLGLSGKQGKIYANLLKNKSNTVEV